MPNQSKLFQFFLVLFLLPTDVLAQDYTGAAIGGAIAFALKIWAVVLCSLVAIALLSLYFFPAEKFSLKKRLLISMAAGLFLPPLLFYGMIQGEKYVQEKEMATAHEYIKVSLSNSSEKPDDGESFHGSKIYFDEKFRIENQRLSDFPSKAKLYLNSIDTIYIVGKVSSIASGVLDPYSNLTSLSIYSDQMKEVPKNIFPALLNLNRLDFDRCHFPIIQNQSFVKLYKLQSLGVRNCSISKMEAQSFQDLPRLEFLDLFGNNLAELPIYALGNLPSLRVLYLGKNQLVEIPSGAFGNAKKLEFLSLDQMPTLKKISPGAFYGLFHLKQVDLSGSGIKQLSKTEVGVPQTCQIAGVKYVSR